MRSRSGIRWEAKLDDDRVMNNRLLGSECACEIREGKERDGGRERGVVDRAIV